MKLFKVMQTLFILPFLLFSSCSTSDESMNDIEYPSALKQARIDTEKGNYVGAEGQVRKYLKSPKDVYWHGHAYLLLGGALEASDKPEEALEAYKQAITQGAGFDRKVTTQALYRTSWIYEKTLKYENLIIVLNDLERVLTDADFFIKYIENPSRLANAYYALGLWDKALEQRDRVTPQIITSAQQKAPLAYKLQAARLYRAFVTMKANTPPDPAVLIPLTQKEILDLGEMAEMNLSNTAFARLKELYSLKWKDLSLRKTPKKLEQRLESNKEILDEMAHFMDWIQDLKASRRPKELLANPQGSDEFFRFLEGVEKEVRARVSKLDMGVQRYPKKGSAHD